MNILQSMRDRKRRGFGICFVDEDRCFFRMNGYRQLKKQREYNAKSICQSFLLLQVYSKMLEIFSWCVAFLRYSLWIVQWQVHTTWATSLVIIKQHNLKSLYASWNVFRIRQNFQNTIANLSFQHQRGRRKATASWNILLP